MACYQVNLVSVEFKAKNKKHLENALKSLNIPHNWNKEVVYLSGSQYIDTENNKAKVNDYFDINKLKRAYSIQAVSEMARKKRWIVKQTGNRKIQVKKY